MDPTNIAMLFNLGLVFGSLRQYCSAMIYWGTAEQLSNKRGSSEVDGELLQLIAACKLALEEV